MSARSHQEGSSAWPAQASSSSPAISACEGRGKAYLSPRPPGRRHAAGSGGTADDVAAALAATERSSARAVAGSELVHAAELSEDAGDRLTAEVEPMHSQGSWDDW